MRILPVLLCLITNLSYGVGATQILPEQETVCGLKRIHSAVAQLNRSQLSSGFFPYDYDFISGNSTDMAEIDGVNLVRQAGGAFVLGEYLEACIHQPTTQTLTTFIEKAVSRSLPISKGYLQRGLEWLGLYNRWQIWVPLREPLYRSGLLFSTEGEALLVTVHEDYESAWPGATALTLIAALKYRRATTDRQFDEMITRWKNGLLALKVPGRGFREAPHYLSESPYVNGEGWLAIAEYSRIFPEDDNANQILLELDKYILQKYGDGGNSRFYHWGTMAAVVRSDMSQDGRFDDFIYRLTEHYLNTEEQKEYPIVNRCSAVEGLATFVAFMNNRGLRTDPLVLRARKFIALTMAANRQLQVDAKFAASLANGEKHLSALDRYQGAFVKSLDDPVMRVDYTQHCINAMLRMYKAGID